MDAMYSNCHYKARRVFLGDEFEVRLFDVDAVGIAAVIFQATGTDALKFTRVFSRAHLQRAGILRTLEGYVTLVDSLELVEDAFFTGADATHAGQPELAAYQLSSSLPGIAYPPPIVSRPAAAAYLTRAPVGLATWNESRHETLLLDVVAKGLTELCRAKPAGLDAVQWLGTWLLDHNPSQPAPVVEGE